MTEGQEKKSEEEVLFPGIEIYGHTVMPWTWDQFGLVAVDLLRMKNILKGGGDLQAEVFKIGADTDPDAIFQTLAALIPLIPAKEIISKTLDIDAGEVAKWPFDKTSGILVVVVLQNIRQIKNLFGLAPLVMKLWERFLTTP
jgi:hypothetical protein